MMDIEIGVVDPMDICKLQVSNWAYKNATYALLGYSVGATVVIKLQSMKIKNLTTKASKIIEENKE